MNASGPSWWYVKVDSDNDVVPSGNSSLYGITIQNKFYDIFNSVMFTRIIRVLHVNSEEDI